MARAARDEGIKGLVNMSQGATVEVCYKTFSTNPDSILETLAFIHESNFSYHYDATCIDFGRFRLDSTSPAK
jgi:hypothetical protein